MKAPVRLLVVALAILGGIASTPTQAAKGTFAPKTSMVPPTCAPSDTACIEEWYCANFHICTGNGNPGGN